MKIIIKKLYPDAVIQTNAHATDAGFDSPCVRTMCFFMVLD